MGTVGKAGIDAWIGAQTGGVLPGNLKLGISSKVTRAIHVDGSPVVAVAGDIEFDTQLHALVDLLHWQHSTALEAKRGRVVIGAGPKVAGLCDAMATLRAELDRETSPQLSILESDGTLTPVSGPPSYTTSGAPWAAKLAKWDATEPAFRAAGFLDAIQAQETVGVSLHPDLTELTWSIRVDGLRVGRIHRAKPDSISLEVGTAGGTAEPTKDFAKIAGAAKVVTECANTAAELVAQLADHWRTKKGGHGQPEHALEAAILRGDVGVTTGTGDTLARVDSSGRVLRAGQFPTLWSVQPGVRARYLDVVMRVGATPWAVELKVSKANLEIRSAVAQAVMYAAFIRQATPLHGWFERRGLDATKCRAAIVVPPGIAPTWREPLLAVAARFGVAVAEVPPPAPYGQ
jgi:hypothetical protein